MCSSITDSPFSKGVRRRASGDKSFCRPEIDVLGSRFGPRRRCRGGEQILAVLCDLRLRSATAIKWIGSEVWGLRLTIEDYFSSALDLVDGWTTFLDSRLGFRGRAVVV